MGLNQAGILLHFSVFIAKERESKTARQALTELHRQFGSEELAMSIVSVVELAHGVARANTPRRQAKRQEHLAHLTAALDVHSINVPIALRAGYIDGENAAKGLRLALADLLIGVTALELGFRVATSNVPHFQMIQGLTVLPI